MIVCMNECACALWHVNNYPVDSMVWFSNTYPLDNNAVHPWDIGTSCFRILQPMKSPLFNSVRRVISLFNAQSLYSIFTVFCID